MYYIVYYDNYTHVRNKFNNDYDNCKAIGHYLFYSYVTNKIANSYNLCRYKYTYIYCRNSQNLFHIQFRYYINTEKMNFP